MKSKIAKSTRENQSIGWPAAIIIGMCCLMSACNDFLEGEPEIAFTTQTFYTDTTKLAMAVLGVYEPLANESTFGRDLPVIDNAGTDLMQSNSLEPTATGTAPAQIGAYNIGATSSYVASVWNYLYQGVNYANSFIANAARLTNSPISNVQKTARKYVAEAKTLRAIYYTEIANRWGDAPLRTKPTTLENTNSRHATHTEIYDQVIKDLEEAIIDLPWNGESGAMVGHLNKGAAMALLARACLFAGGYHLYQDGEIRRPDNWQEYYKKAEIYTRELISSGKHKLNTSYEQIFKNVCQNIPEPLESLFEIDFAYINGDNTHAGRIGIWIGVNITDPSNLYKSSPSIFTNYFAYSKYKDGDKRRDVNIAKYTLKKGKNFVETPIDVKSSNKWGIGKWRRDWHIPAPTHQNYSDANYPMIRYAEVLLMRAEVLNELSGGPTEEAIELVNQVRRRGYGVPIDTSSKVADIPMEYCTDKDKFFMFLTDEYARETLGEFGRKFQLVRWGLLYEKLGELNAFFMNPANYGVYHSLKCAEYFGAILSYGLFIHGKHELWPIPLTEITESHGHITQNNPGY